MDVFITKEDVEAAIKEKSDSAVGTNILSYTIFEKDS